MKTSIKKFYKLLSIIIIVFFIAYSSWYFLFNIYVVDFNYTLLKSNSSSITYKINSVPINSFGIKVPFREIDFTYEIISGKNFIISKDKELVVYRNHDDIEIIIQSEYSLFKEKLLIKQNDN